MEQKTREKKSAKLADASPNVLQTAGESESGGQGDFRDTQIIFVDHHFYKPDLHRHTTYD